MFVPTLLYLIKNTHGELIVLVYHLQTHHKEGVPEGSSVDGEEEPQLLRDIQLGLLYISSIFSVFFKNVIRLINIIKMHRSLGGGEECELVTLISNTVKGMFDKTNIHLHIYDSRPVRGEEERHNM